MYFKFSLIESSYLLFENGCSKFLRWIQDPVNIQNRAEPFEKIVIIFAGLYLHWNFPLRFWQGLKTATKILKRGEKKYMPTNFYFYKVINCLNKNLITHFVRHLEKKNRYDIETLSIDRVVNKQHFYWKIMQKMFIKNCSQTPF